MDEGIVENESSTTVLSPPDVESQNIPNDGEGTVDNVISFREKTDNDRTGIVENIGEGEQIINQDTSTDVSKRNIVKMWKKSLTNFSHKTISRALRLIKFILYNTSIELELDMRSKTVFFNDMRLSLKLFVKLFRDRYSNGKSLKRNEVSQLNQVYTALPDSGRKLVNKPIKKRF